MARKSENGSETTYWRLKSGNFSRAIGSPRPGSSTVERQHFTTGDVVEFDAKGPPKSFLAMFDRVVNPEVTVEADDDPARK